MTAYLFTSTAGVSNEEADGDSIMSSYLPLVIERKRGVNSRICST